MALKVEEKEIYGDLSESDGETATQEENKSESIVMEQGSVDPNTGKPPGL